MINETVQREIEARLERVEQEHDVRVLFAVESGSRAWGFASPNSDFDVRFIYAHSRDWYLSVNLEEQRDVIAYETVDEIDLNGWDLRKTLKLLWNSNPSCVEWLQSPVVYVNRGDFAERARALLPDIYSVKKGVHYYLQMADKNYHGYLKAQLVPLKKYFYVLRPLLAIRWLERFQAPAPIEFELLQELVADNATLNREITRLLARKQRSEDKEFIAAIPALNHFIEHELARFARYQPPEPHGENITALNLLFRDILSADIQ